MKSQMLSESTGIKVVCVVALGLVFALSNGFGKPRHCTFRVHVQANPHDSDTFSMSAPATSRGKDIAIEKTPWITEHNVVGFAPYQSPDGTYGALIQLDDHGRVVLDTLSIEHRGSLLFIFVNGRLITALQIDKRVSDGKIYVPSGLSTADIEVMKKDWRPIGHGKH